MDLLPPTDDETTAAAADIRPIRGGMEADRPGSHARNAARRGAGIRTVSALTSLLAVAAGIAAAMAHGAPTQIHPLDLALKFLLAAACVVAGRLTPWPFVAAAALVAAAASYRSPAALVAVAAIGIALYGWGRSARDPSRLAVAAEPDVEAAGDDTIRRLTPADGAGEPTAAEVASGQLNGNRLLAPGAGRRRRRRSDPLRLSLVRAATCGALAGVAVRSSWPRVSLGTSLLAGVVVILLIVPGVLVAPPRTRRVVLRATGLVALAGLLLVAVAGATIYMARSPLRSALGAARSGLVAAEHGDQTTAVADFRRSEADFRSAQGDLAWARAGEIVPVLSQQVRAIRTATSVGETLARAGITTASTASVRDLKLVNGAFPVARLEALRPVFQQDLNVLRSVMRSTSSFSSPWIVSALRTRLDSVDARLQRANHDAQIGLLGSEEVPGLLGANGLRTYLVLVENPAEARASGGVIGDYAEVTANDGRLHLVKVGSVETLNRDGVPAKQRTLPAIPDFVNRYGDFYPQDHWENISMSPDFPTVGAVVDDLFPQSGGVKLNGVISVDPVAMAGFLRMVGPVSAKGLNEKITPANVVLFLAHQEFVQFTDNKLRIQYVELLLKKVWHELTSRSLPPVTQLVKDLQPAVKGGHLFMYSPVAAEESFFSTVHLAGAMPPVSGDFVGVVTQNNAGNKIDWYLRRVISYNAALNLQWHTITSTLTVTLVNTAPSSGQPAIVIDGARGANTTAGENLTWFNVYTPWQLQSATVNGQKLAMTSQYELGRQVYSADIGIPAGGTDVVTLHLAGTWPSSVSHYQLGWYHQPVLVKDVVSSHVTVIH